VKDQGYINGGNNLSSMIVQDTSDKSFRTHDLQAEGITINLVEGGDPDHPAVLFLHGWPESKIAWKQVMLRLLPEMHVLAVDLPGIGGSVQRPRAYDKHTLAVYIRGVINTLGLSGVTLAGHDVGGQIVYAYLHAYPGELKRAVIMNVVVPGIDPWSEVRHNPYIWHFGFHAIPNLPEALVSGNEAVYFDYFYNALLANSDAIDRTTRDAYAQAYSRPDALRTGFDWYRAFPQDEKDNTATRSEPVDTPVLYLRGEQEGGMLDRYLEGFRNGGLRNIRGQLIPGSGHFAPEEQPEAVAAALREFIRDEPAAKE
jgi:pimeloyl-ACP methyl ester carboxylesterase